MPGVQVRCWAHQNSSGMDIVEKGQQKATNRMEVLEHLLFEEKQTELGPLSLEKGSGESYPCVPMCTCRVEQMEPGFSH